MALCVDQLCEDKDTGSSALERRSGTMDAGGEANGATSGDFSAALLRYHLRNTESAGRGSIETDSGEPSFLHLIKNDLTLPKEGLEMGLCLKLPTEDVNERHPSDRDAYGEVAVLHRLVTGHYTHKIDLVTTLMTFSDADIDLTTSRGKTAFHLAVELGNVELMQNLAALGADVNMSDDNQCTPYETALKNDGGHSTETTRMMIALMEDVCAVSTGKKFACTEHEHRDSGYTDGASTQQSKAEHGVSPSKRQMRLDSEQVTKLILDSDMSPVEIVKRLQESATDQRRRGVRVLCLDGGGVRGLVQLEILRQIEEKLPGTRACRIADLFDYIVGTSTGGIIALAMVYGERTVRQLQQLYLQMKNAVFAKQSLFELGDTEKLEDYLTLWLDKDMTMDKKKHPKVLVSAVMRETTHVQLHWFSNFLNDDNSRALVWEVARRTSAAPFYFTPIDKYVDGGLLANNPSLHALTTIQTHLRSEGDSRGVSLVVSVGTGMNPPREYGNLQITNILDYVFKNKKILLFMGDVIGSHSVTCEASCHCMCEEQGIEYVRLDPSLATEVDSGETENRKLLNMLWTTRKYLHQFEHHLNTLKEFFIHYARDSY